MATFLLTILGGVSIFIVGQILMKLIIEPAQELKKSLGTVSNTLLLHQAQLTNAAFNKEIAFQIKSISAEILSKSGVLLGYDFVHKLFDLPSKANILMASRELNQISYGMREESKAYEDSPDYNAEKSNFAMENTKAIIEVGKLLNLQTTYGGR